MVNNYRVERGGERRAQKDGDGGGGLEWDGVQEVVESEE